LADPFVSDGCTGFQWAEWIWPAIHECCATHDYGGSDGQLLDCLTGAGGVPAMLALVGIAIMVLARPAYELWLRIKNRA
jgi:hypothetical protein